MNAHVHPPVDLLQAGVDALTRHDVEAAVVLLRQAVEASPGTWEAGYWRYSALMRAGDWDGAQAALCDARTLHSLSEMRAAGADVIRLRRDRAYAYDIGLQFYRAHRMSEASVAMGFALDMDHPDPERLIAYGLSLQHQGRMDEAIGVFQLADAVVEHPAVPGHLIYALFHHPDRGHVVREAATAWAARYADPYIPVAPVFANSRSLERRLRIGYVAPSFASSQVRQFLQPVLEAHDPGAVEVFLYGAATEAEPGLPPAPRFKSLAGVSDDQAAALVRGDGVDILVDCWGHTAGSRLGMFARRPAPVQVAWLNFVQTTGLKAIDYVLHAEGVGGPETAAQFVEEVWIVGPVFAPFRPMDGRPDPAPTPALANGHVTYGSFNHPAKLSDETIGAWGAILRSRPRDRLVLKYRYFVDPVLQRATLARFACHGVYTDQIEFRGETKGADYLGEFADIDLALDPSPCPGGTTTCDALSLGVPVLTLRGGDYYARIGLPGVLPCGLPELVARDWQDYVGRALALTEDAAALNALRARVRPGFEASIYRDEVGFTRNLEAQYRAMFAAWAEGAAA